jgi:hypothetical protein
MKMSPDLEVKVGANDRAYECAIVKDREKNKRKTDPGSHGLNTDGAGGWEDKFKERLRGSASFGLVTPTVHCWLPGSSVAPGSLALNSRKSPRRRTMACHRAATTHVYVSSARGSTDRGLESHLWNGCLRVALSNRVRMHHLILGAIV